MNTTHGTTDGTTDGTLTYVYAAAPHTQRLRDAVAGLRGIYGSPVMLLMAPPSTRRPLLAFASSHVPRRDFNEDALKNHFEDLEWLESVARAHHDVVQALSLRTAVLPLRMATVYQDDDRAGQALAEQHNAFAQRLAELTDHTEFGVKVYLTPTRSGTETTGTASGPPAATTPGKAYLQRRKAQHSAQEAVYSQAQRAAAAIEAIAARYASRHARHPTQSGALTGPAENVLNDAYLVPDTYAEQFRAAIVEAADAFDSVRVEVTGPWAPYSFAMAPPERPETTATSTSTGQGHPS
ncbi:GvpL/GvpF family gas vesicle protein [Streptomyces sp. NPDC058674]|uniref:GvpL/GvpF family gas vesicle protein n=1 Tax=Streptomyces sp. NPDC058674 TaxID=3346592 RepID=UPI003660773D